jgi:hypothetical protein
MMSERYAAARQSLLELFQRALHHHEGNVTAHDHPMVDGSWITLRVNDAVRCVVDARLTDDDPFDDAARDRLRSAAVRLQAPLAMICTLRRAVVFDVAAMARRAPDDEQVLHQALLAADQPALVVPALRSVVEAMLNAHAQNLRIAPEEFFEERLRHITAELVACTDGSTRQRTAVVRLATSVLAYGLIQMRNEETLDPLRIPYRLKNPRLMLDIVGAYFRCARVAGHTVFPASVDDVRILPQYTSLFRMALADLCSIIHRVEPSRFDDVALHRAVDAYLQWTSGTRHVAAPVIDLVDVGLRMAQRHMVVDGTPTLLELGAANGLFSVRANVLADSSGMLAPEAYVYVPTSDDERHAVLRTAGRLDSADGIHLLRRRVTLDRPWNLVCAATTDPAERHRLHLLLSRLQFANTAAVVLVLPLEALYAAHWSALRTTLSEVFTVEWIITSDGQPLAYPDAGVCCIVARKGDSPAQPARFVTMRKTFESFFLPCSVARERDAKRVQGIETFIRYLSASERGKNNAEAVVRTVEAQRLAVTASADGGWYPFAVPADVLARLVQKANGKLQRLDAYGTVVNGLRTGANDVFIVDGADIAHHSFEPRYWQRTLMSGHTVDNLVVTDADDVTSITGLPTTDRRLLLIPDADPTLPGTAVRAWLDAAEREGVHARPSLRQRNPWWVVPEPVAPDLIIPKRQHPRRIVATNAAAAFITDAAVGVVLHDARHAEPLALWLNSTPGLFYDALYRERRHRADVTVRDAESLPVPDPTSLAGVHPGRHRSFLRRPLQTIEEEWGTADAGAARLDGIARDRRGVDKWFSEMMLGLTAEEQRTMLRLLMVFWSGCSAQRFVVEALEHELLERHTLEPLREWYAVAINQLPDAYKRVVLIPEHITAAHVAQSMFTWQVTLMRGSKADEVVECASAEEAHILRLFVELGKRHIEVPLDAPIIADLLPRLGTFRAELDAAIAAVTRIIPDGSIRDRVAEALRARMTELA